MLLEKDGRKLGIHVVGLLAGFEQAAIVDDREWVEENTRTSGRKFKQARTNWKRSCQR